MTEIEQLRQQHEQADAEFAAACQQLSTAQKAVHAARKRCKTAQRRYIEVITEGKAS